MTNGLLVLRIRKYCRPALQRSKGSQGAIPVPSKGTKTHDAPIARRNCVRGLRQGTLLDVGGGLGILSLELLDAGFSRATVVDASSAYLAAASEEAMQRGYSASTEFVTAIS